ncbi:hypothetical protein NDU88_000278 [Pleurodeles waltl]|uniref:Uncharacterized protein n=1 Tax=Pleurodeles waltl TaxID=8319 RepID=A0AAV7WH42_PLEWA|nr:hypothetical protein NDU88_000278 [Pleurodeles waltl]
MSSRRPVLQNSVTEDVENLDDFLCTQGSGDTRSRGNEQEEILPLPGSSSEGRESRREPLGALTLEVSEPPRAGSGGWHLGPRPLQSRRLRGFVLL